VTEPPKKTHYKTLLENSYIGQWSLSDGKGGFRRVVLQIASAEKYEPEQRQKKKVKRPDGTYAYVDAPNRKVKVWFVGKRLPLLANPTIQRTIESMYGPYLEDWAGKYIALYVDVNVDFGGKRTGGLRVENKIPKPGGAPAGPLDGPVDQEAAARIAAAVDGSGPGGDNE
jgi:hypothetical protein